MQRGEDPDAIIFQEMANQGHYRTTGGTRQGIYVCSAGGKLMSSINSLNADDVLKTIEAGLDKWDALPVSEKLLSNGYVLNIKHRWENSYPDQGLVLTSVNADFNHHTLKISNDNIKKNCINFL